MFPTLVFRCLAESSPRACEIIWPMPCGMGRQTMGLCNAFSSWYGPTYQPGWRYVDRKPDTNALECAAQVYRRMAALDAANPLRLAI